MLTTPKEASTDHWVSLLIAALWWLTNKMWQFCSHIVNGATAEETVTITMNRLHKIVRQHYTACEASHSYIFPQHYLQQQLQMSYYYIQSWIRSIEDTRAILLFKKII